MSGELRHRPPAPPYEETTPRGALEHHHHHDKHHLVSPHSSEGSVSDVPSKWEEFCDKTTAHGFKRYLQAHNRVSGFLWIGVSGGKVSKTGEDHLDFGTVSRKP
ncbi:unnamed protein product, partial [Mesorhabditis spiculigera]